MNKLIYVSFENSENRASGVNKKITGQIKVFEEDGFSTDLIAHYQNNIALFNGDSEPQVIESSIPWRIALCGWAAKHAGEYDVAYIRFQFFCPFVLNMVRLFHKAGVKTVMEIPTYPYVTELKKQGMRGIHKRIIDASFRNACAKYIDRFAAPLYDDPIMGKTCVEIRNGIDVEDIPPKRLKDADGKIHLLAVAMMAPWHGYDRMIEGLHQYYITGGTKDVVLHLVGQGVASAGYNELIDSYNLNEHVVQHGKLHGEALDDMYDIADIGVGSLGVHRTEITKTNTLKVLEYLAKGIPVICEPSENGISIDNPYRLTVSPDETAIDIRDVIVFYQKVYGNNDSMTVIQSIRDECRTKCDIKAGLQGVLSFIEEKA